MSIAAALRSASEQQRPRALKTASREIFQNRGASRGRSAAYAFGASRDFAYAYGKSRQDRQFLQTDPVGYEDDLNLYAYVRNDPLNLSDPTGMCYDSPDQCDYTEAETRGMLTGAREEATAGFMAGLHNIGNSVDNGGDYDFQAGDTWQDTWTFEGETYNASEMGNFVAGFMGGSHDEEFGTPIASAAVRVAGIAFSIGKGDLDLDARSAPSISAGQNAARGFEPSTAPEPGSALDPHSDVGRAELYTSEEDYRRRSPPLPETIR